MESKHSKLYEFYPRLKILKQCSDKNRGQIFSLMNFMVSSKLKCWLCAENISTVGISSCFVKYFQLKESEKFQIIVLGGVDCWNCLTLNHCFLHKIPDQELNRGILVGLEYCQTEGIKIGWQFGDPSNREACLNELSKGVFRGVETAEYFLFRLYSQAKTRGMKEFSGNDPLKSDLRSFAAEICHWIRLEDIETRTNIPLSQMQEFYYYLENISGK